jgi:hypothetical protein
METYELVITLVIIVIIVVAIIYLFVQYKTTSNDFNKALQNLVDKINNSNYYQYNNDIQNIQNIENNEKNIKELNDSVLNLQNNVQVLQYNTVTNESITNNVTTRSAYVNDIQLGEKWLLSGSGDTFADDGWLRVLNTDQSDFYGGIAVGDLWTKNDATINGNLHLGNQFCINKTCISENNLKNILKL